MLPLLLNAGVLPAAELNLMPMPARINRSSGTLLIDSSFRVELQGSPADAGVADAAARLVRRLEAQTGIPMTDRPPSTAGAPALTVRWAKGRNAIQTLGEDESYRLEVTPTGAVLSAVTPLGVFCGFSTFAQLVARAGSGFGVPALSIVDQPRFPWRGLHIDVARHWMPLPIIQRNLDGMAAVKLNVFHWHLSDNQGFRVESHIYPKLQEDGSDGLYYTQEQVREVITYAHARGIRVLPEFDIPGHTTAWLAGYPELAAGPGPFAIERKWGIFDPALDPTKEIVYEFLDRLIGEMAALFPDDYFHIGGDEVNGRQWNQSASVAAFKSSHGIQSNEKLQAYFNQRVQVLVTRHGKKMMGWDEILAQELPKDVVIHSWRGQESLAEAVKLGFNGVLSAGYYLDLVQPAGSHYRVDPLIDPKTKQPLALTPEQRARIYGGEACMWSEYVSQENIDSRIWPRAAAIAERFWSPQATNDVNSMYARLEPVSRNLQFLGLTHKSSYLPMLERLAGSQPVEPLRVLADVVEPVKGYSRERNLPYTSRTPLNRLVDAARPESDTARVFASQVDRYLSGDKSMLPAIRLQLARWRDNGPPLDTVIAGSGLLAEAAPVAKNLAATGAAGLQALIVLETKNRPAPGWGANARSLLEEAGKPKAELLLMVAPPVRKLVDAAIRSL